MNKIYSIRSGDIFRSHPIALIGFLALILAILTSGVFRIVFIILLIIVVFAVAITSMYRDLFDKYHK